MIWFCLFSEIPERNVSRGNSQNGRVFTAIRLAHFVPTARLPNVPETPIMEFDEEYLVTVEENGGIRPTLEMILS